MDIPKTLECLKALQNFDQLLKKLDPEFAKKQKRSLNSIKAELLRELEKTA